MGFKDAAKHRMLNHLVGNSATSGPITHASLHTGYPATAANELTGGSPAYARKAISFEAVAGTELAGSVDATNQPVFDVPAGTTVSAAGFCTAISGNDTTIITEANLTDEAYVGQGTYTLTDVDLSIT